VRGFTLKTGQKLNSGVVIDAEGCASHLLKQANLQAFDQSSAVVAVNCDVENIKDIETDTVEVYLTQRYAPGLFAWIIPRRDGSAKVGLATKVGNPRDCLRQFLDSHPVVKRKIKSDDVRSASYHLIPLGGPIPKTYRGGFLAVGDAASHVKPTTGGGVIIGLTCSKIAGEIAGQAVKINDFSERFLSSYQQICRQKVGFDLRAMRYVRLMLNRMPDSRLDEMIGLCSRLRLGESLKSVKDIDFQGQALIPLLMNPATMIAFLYFVFASLSS
jgi:flavin-dependent dehydrogenase